MKDFFTFPSSRFMGLKEYMNQCGIDKIEFGPENQPPFYWAKFYNISGELVLTTVLSEALRKNEEFYIRLGNNNLFEEEYLICFNGYKSLNYLTMPKPTITL